MKFDLIDSLFEIEGKTYGVPNNEIDGVEKKLKKPIPQYLRSFHEKYGRHTIIMSAQNRFIPLEDLKIENGWLRILHENQFVAEWAIQESDLELEDPPVFVTYDGIKWEKESNSLKKFLYFNIIFNALMGLEFTANVVGLKNFDLSILQNGWQTIDEGFKVWNTSLHVAPDGKSIMGIFGKNEHDLFIASNSENSFDQLESTLDLEWDYSSKEESKNG